MNPSTKELALQICENMDDKKAKDIVVIDITDRTVIADAFVVGSGRSDQQVRAIVDEVEEQMEKKLPLLRKEGYREGRWVVLDYGDILVHVFHDEERKYYDLERLWADEDNLLRFHSAAESRD